MDLTDQELMGAIAAGDAGAFAAFYDRHAGRVYGLLMRMLKDAGEAEDVLQEVFWQMWSRSGQFDEARGHPITWMVQITRSRALDYRRRLKRTVRTVPGERDIVGDGDASTEVELAETSQWVCQELSKLPSDQASAIRWAFFDGLSHSEIAARAGLPIGTVKTRIRLGMLKLREKLGD